MYDTPVKRRGRGAQSNRSGRYETLVKINIDDGWHQPAGLSGENAAEDGGEFIDDVFSGQPLRTQWREDRAKTIITRNQSPDIHFEQSINPYRGCEHGCVYCFARPTHTYLGHSAGLDFERILYAKIDAAKLLRQELSKPRYQCKPIAIGVNTDAYQPLERKLAITRQLLQLLLEVEHPAYLVTKSSLIERDMDILQRMAEKNLVTVSISVTSLDNKLSNRLEPRASAPHRRLRTIKTLSDANIPVHTLIAPVIPALNEHELDDIIAAVADAGSRSANALILRLPHELVDLFDEWLEAHYPLKKNRVLKAIRSLRSGKLNDSSFKTRFTGEGPRAQIIQRRFANACRRHGLEAGRESFDLDTTHFQRPVCRQGKRGGQLSLF